jgi:uncharacterized protein YjeT (DUF2065 family)
VGEGIVNAPNKPWRHTERFGVGVLIVGALLTCGALAVGAWPIAVQMAADVYQSIPTWRTFGQMWDHSPLATLILIGMLLVLIGLLVLRFVEIERRINPVKETIRKAGGR